MRKIVIFGIDGASLKLIEQWRDELPNLSRFMENGVYGELESTIPPITCPAWPCMFTGKNPGKLDMYGFLSVEPSGEYPIKISTSLDYHQWSLWKILNDYGIKVGLLNVAMTFPPHKVDSFMVCGTGAPVGGQTDYTYPPWLKKELSRVVPGYEVLPPMVLTITGKEKEYQAFLEQAVQNRLKAAEYLMNAFPWQLLVNVFFSTDSAQHYFWHHMDETHPRQRKEKYRDTIKNLYQMVDAAIGKLVKKLPEETNIMIVSDHGFGPCHGHFVVSKWLEKQGLLSFLPSIEDETKISFMWRLRDFLLSVLNARVVQLIARMVPQWLAMKISSRGKSGYEVVTIYRSIDWAKTKAYPEGSSNLIRINLKGREPSGIVEPGEEYEQLVADIANRLKNITDPETGKVLGTEVFTRKELYQRDYAGPGPDIAFTIEKYMPMAGGSFESEWSYSPYSGWHTRDGIFIAYGPDIKGSGEKLNNLKIYDITPTLLHMFGLPVPDDMDGRVLREIFKEESEVKRREVKYHKVAELRRITSKIKKLKRSSRI